MIPTADQIAAMQRAKNPGRKFFGQQPIAPRGSSQSGQKIIPVHARLVR